MLIIDATAIVQATITRQKSPARGEWFLLLKNNILTVVLYVVNNATINSRVVKDSISGKRI